MHSNSWYDVLAIKLILINQLQNPGVPMPHASGEPDLGPMLPTLAGYL